MSANPPDPHDGRATAARHREWLRAAAILLLAFAVFAPSFQSPWLMDDRKVIVQNPDVRSISNFVEDYYPGRPVRELTYLVDYTLFGYDSAPWHVQQVFWHALCALLMLALATRIGAPWQAATLAALIFLLHPIQVEVVANVSHRKDSLALAFSLASLLAYMKGREGAGIARWGILLLALLLWITACHAKQNAIMLIAIVGALELRRLPVAYRSRVAWALLGATVLATLARVTWLASDPEFLERVQPALHKIDYWGEPTFQTYLLTVLKAWSWMASKLIVPARLSMEYTFPPPAGWVDPWAVGGLALATAAVAGVVLCFTRGLALFIAIVWAAAFWLPTSNLFGIYAYFAADRYLYSPLAGIALLLSLGLWHLLSRTPRVYWTLAVALAAGLTVLSVHQQGYWRDAQSFYAHMLEVSPRAHEGFVGMGGAARDAGRLDEARRYWERAADSGNADPHVLASLGGLYDELGMAAQAEATLLKALAIDPQHHTALLNLGALYERAGRYERAEDTLRQAIAALPGYGLAHYNLGVVLYRRDRKEAALDQFARAVELLPDHSGAVSNWGTVALELGRQDLAERALARLREIAPGKARELANQIEANAADARP